MNIAMATAIPVADTWGMHGDDVGFGWMMLGMVLFWGAVIFLIVWLVRGGFEGRRERRNATPIELLERRFAEGAISVEDYRARREVLVNRPPPPRGDRKENPLTAPLEPEGRR
jgi:putative membrane protein